MSSSYTNYTPTHPCPGSESGSDSESGSGSDRGASSASDISHPPPPPPPPSPKKAWVEPTRLPNATYETLDYPDAREVLGNVPIRAKQLALNTFAAYGVSGLPIVIPNRGSGGSRDEDSEGREGEEEEEVFGRCAGRKVKFVRIDVGRSTTCDGCANGQVTDNSETETATAMEREAAMERKRKTACGRPVMSVTAVAELHVDRSMVNGNGMMHGGCIAYLIDNCASIPLVVLGVLRNRNGVGVTQAMNVMFHAPAPLGTKLEIVSTSLTLGGRSMSAKCEIFDKSTGRLVASAFLNKMEPRL